MIGDDLPIAKIRHRKEKSPRPKKPRSKLPAKNAPRKAKRFVTDFGGAEYLAFIKSLPCDVCGAEGLTEAAHLKSRGAGGKADVVAPLCGVHPNGDIGCHRRFDLFHHVARAHEVRLKELAKARRKAFEFAIGCAA